MPSETHMFRVVMRRAAAAKPQPWGIVFQREVLPLTVKEVRPGSIAAAHGLKTDDAIVAIGGRTAPTFKSGVERFTEHVVDLDVCRRMASDTASQPRRAQPAAYIPPPPPSARGATQLDAKAAPASDPSVPNQAVAAAHNGAWTKFPVLEQDQASRRRSPSVPPSVASPIASQSPTPSEDEDAADESVARKLQTTPPSSGRRHRVASLPTSDNEGADVPAEPRRSVLAGLRAAADIPVEARFATMPRAVAAAVRHPPMHPARDLAVESVSFGAVSEAVAALEPYVPQCPYPRAAAAELEQLLGAVAADVRIEAALTAGKELSMHRAAMGKPIGTTPLAQLL